MACPSPYPIHLPFLALIQPSPEVLLQLYLGKMLGAGLPLSCFSVLEGNIDVLTLGQPDCVQR